MKIIKILLILFCTLFYSKLVLAEENGTREQAEQLLERSIAIFNIDCFHNFLTVPKFLIVLK